MVNATKVQNIGLLFMPLTDVPLFFTLSRMSYAGLEASKTKGKQVEREAGRKSWKNRT
jgi:hypothetical protein